VIEANRLPAGGRIGGPFADGEEAEVVIVVGALGLHEHGAGNGERQTSETQHLFIEASGTLGVPDVQDGMVETMN
jgi:hypothetical protein